MPPITSTKRSPLSTVRTQALHVRGGLRIAIVLLAATLQACGGSSGTGGSQNTSQEFASREYPNTPLSCDIEDMRLWVDANMRDYYLFADRVKRVPLENYQTPEALLADLRVLPEDRFSGITDAARSDDLFERGESFGFGHYLLRDGADEKVRVANVEPGSPFADAGIVRGEYLVALNGNPDGEWARNDVLALFGAETTPVTLDVTVEAADGTTRTLSITSANYAVQTVQTANVFTINGVNIGYMMFNSFLETSVQELDSAVAFLRDESISELVLDLRYNTGGRVSVGAILASLIADNSTATQPFTTISYNERYRDLNQSINMLALNNSLNLNRLVVLTTEDSCSASELVINGLRPFMEVIVIGDTTCGKPYGTSARTACGKNMNALEIGFVNANGVGDYFQGLAADCPVQDTLDFDFGDSRDALLNAGLNYIVNGICPTALANGLATDPATGAINRQATSKTKPYRDTAWPQVMPWSLVDAPTGRYQ